MANVKKPVNKKTKVDVQTKVVPRVAANGYRLPDPIPPGEVLIDNSKNEWMIGESIGCGGFGEIYAAKNKNDSSSDYDKVIKVDHLNGPLYAEMHFYLRVAKEEEVNKWMQAKGLKFLGLPRYISFGIHERSQTNVPVKGRRTTKKTVDTGSSTKYRFLVMQRFGQDLQKLLNDNNNKFSVKTAYSLAIKIIDILEYIHHHGYIHADIKASNLLLVRKKISPRKNTKFHSSEVYLVDYGLVERYMSREGQHRDYGEDIRRANNGTTEFSSRDAHIGAFSRRSDLEILAYNVLSWISGGRLPWMSNLKDHKYVKNCKEYYMSRIHELVNFCFSNDTKQATNGFSSNEISHKSSNTSDTKKRSVIDRKKISSNVPIGIVEALQYIVNLDFNEEPDYDLLKKIFETSIEKLGGKANGDQFCFDNSFEEKVKLTRRPLSVHSPQKVKHNLDDEIEEEEVDNKRMKTRHLTRNGKEDKSKTKTIKTKDDNKEDSKSTIKSSSNHPTPQMLELMKKQAVRNRVTRKIKKPSTPTSFSPRSKSVSPVRDATSPFGRPTPQMLELMKKLKQKKIKSKRLS